MLNRHAGHDSSYTINVGVTNKKCSFSIEVVNVIELGPVRRPGCRAFQAFLDIGDAVQDQPDLRLETGSRSAAPLVINRHCRPLTSGLV